jgi:GNAT superfamily N-acetyltransferase
LYCACFAEPPWYEVFEVALVEAEFREYLAMPDAVFLLAEIDGTVVGSSLGFSLGRKSEVACLVGAAWERAFYLSELFVAGSRRHQGIARRLVAERFAAARGQGFRRAVVRTSVDQPVIRRLYASLGFIELARQEVLSAKAVQGEVADQPDQRVILGGRIPA